MRISPQLKEAVAWQAKKELVRRYAKDKDILNWGKVLFPDKFELPFCQEMHQYFVDIRDEEFTSTEAPREFGKTLVNCFLIPLFMALETPKRYLHYCNVQSTITKGKAINIAIKHELESNDLLISVYKNQVDNAKWTEKQFVLSNGVVFTAVGSGESIRGLAYKGVRPDYIIADDLYDEEDIHNIESTQKITNWFWSTLYPARASTRRNCTHIQGTAINKADIMFTMIDKAKQLKTIKAVCKTFQAIIDEGKKEVLWKEFRSWDALMDEKNVMMGTVIFNRERMNVRSSAEESVIKETFIRYYDEIPEGKKIVRRIGSCDPSVGEKLTNDFTAMAAIYLVETPGAPGIYDYYIEDLVNQHLSLNLRVMKLDSFNERHDFNEVRIESIGAFKDFAAEVKRRTDLIVKVIDHVKNKMYNLERESPKFENGRVWVKRSIPVDLRNKLVEQLTNNESIKDDLRDAVLLGLRSKKKVMVC